MYSNKENVNILTSLLVAAGIDRAVVCPGSRNVPIVHNLNLCPGVECYPVTDERSAGFYALGMARASGRPVVVCVTSGSALLNLAPAVAEAFYIHVPLVVVAADRPAAWIGQMDGQTLPQPDALGRFVKHAVSLPEPDGDTARWHCRRLVSEALVMAGQPAAGPVLINVPISEPLFSFTAPALPELRPVRFSRAVHTGGLKEALAGFCMSERPMVVIGSMPQPQITAEMVDSLSGRAVVVCEPLGAAVEAPVLFDEVLLAAGESLAPHNIIYIGDTIVSKRLRRFLRAADVAECILINEDGRVADPLACLSQVVQVACVADVFKELASAGFGHSAEYCHRWRQELRRAGTVAADYEPCYSQMAAVRYLEQQIDDLYSPCHVHYANSSAIRLANIYAGHYVWCNRGVNGIEGSLSAAAGFSVACAGGMVVCVTGDLSFFYDQNALWNTNLGGNLRILLLNNAGGGIFRRLPGLDATAALDTIVAARHGADARGICTQNDIGYMAARTSFDMQMGIVKLLTSHTSRPMLLEVFTDAAADKEALDGYYKVIEQNIKI